MASVLSLDREAEIVLVSPQFLGNAENLSDAERKIVKPEDIWKVALVDGLTSDEQISIGVCFAAINLQDYINTQIREWLETERYLVGTRLGHSPDDTQILEDIINYHTGQRFKLCHTLNHPERMKFHLDAYFGQRRVDVDAFLGLAERQDPNHFPYFSTLVRNSGLVI